MKGSSAIVLISVAVLCIALGAAQRDEDDPGITVVVIRHAEKEASASSPSDPPLSPAGQTRAKHLAHVLKDSGVDAIYVTPFTRTRQTAKPLAGQARLTPISLAADDYETLAAQIQSRPAGETILVVGHSNTVPEIVAKLSGQSVPGIPETEFDHFYVITKRKSGATVLCLRYGNES